MTNLSHRMQHFELGDVVIARRHVYFPCLDATIELGEEWPLVVLQSEQASLDSKVLDVRVAPLSERVDLATDHDLVCSAAEGPLGNPFVVELWNQRAMLVCNIDRVVGALSAPAIDRMCQVHNAMIGALSWSDVPKAWCGDPVTDDADPRLEHQRTRVVQASFLSDPVDDLIEHHNREGDADQYHVTVFVSYVGKTGSEARQVLLMSPNLSSQSGLGAAQPVGNWSATPEQASYLDRFDWRPATGEYLVVPSAPPYAPPQTNRVFGRLRAKTHELGFDVRGLVRLFGLPELSIVDRAELTRADGTLKSTSVMT